MTKKIFAIISALSLLLCAVCVFTVAAVSAKSAPFAGDTALYKPEVTDFVANDGGWIGKEAPATGMGSAANADGSVHLYANNHATKRFYYETSKKYVADADGKIAEVVIGNVTTGGCDRFTLYLNGETGNWLSFCGDGSVLEMTTRLYSGDQAGTVDNPQAVIDMLDGKMTRLTIKKNGEQGIVEIVTEDGKKATATFPTIFKNDTAESWTVGFGQWSGSGDDKYAALDVLAIHGSDEACGDRLFQGDTKNYKPEVTDFVANDGGWIGKEAPATGMGSAANEDGSVHLYANNHATKRFYYETSKKYTADATGTIAEVVIDNVTTGDCDRFTLYLNGETGNWLSFCGDGSVLEMTTRLYSGDQAGTVDNPQAVIDMLDGKMTRLTIKKNGEQGIVEIVTEDGKKATATFPTIFKNDTAESWTVGFGQWSGSGDDKYAELDVLAIHGSDEICGDCGYFGDITYNKPSVDDFISNNTNWYKNGETALGDGHYASLNEDGSVHIYNKGHATACLGFQWKNEPINLNGLHLVISPISFPAFKDGDNFGIQLGTKKCYQMNGNDWDTDNLMIRIKPLSGEFNSYCKAIGSNDTVHFKPYGDDSNPVIAGMTKYVTKFEFSTNGSDLTLTISNAAGTAEIVWPSEKLPPNWTDKTQSYFYLYSSNSGEPMIFDILALHEGDENCADAPGFEPTSPAAAAVIDAINGLGEIKLESKEAIESAEAAYAALTDSEKKLVLNYNTLKEARKAYAALDAAQLRKEYDVAIRVLEEEIVSASSWDLDTWTEENGQLVNCFTSELYHWGDRVYYPYAVGVDGLQLHIKQLDMLNHTLAIGLMNGAGTWIDEALMVRIRVASPAPGNENGFVTVDVFTGNLQSHIALQKSFANNVFADNELFVEYYIKEDGDSVALFIDDEYIGDLSLKDEMGITDPTQVFPTFGLCDGDLDDQGKGIVGGDPDAFSIYSITCKAQAEGIKATEAAIDAIGTVTAQSGEAIEAAQKAYKALGKNIRAYVKNEKTLTDAVAAFEALAEEEPTSEPASEPATEPEQKTDSPKTGEAASLLPIALLIAATGAVVISRKRK